MLLSLALITRGTAVADTSLIVSLSADLPDARLAQLTRNLERDLSRAGIQARPIETPSVPGERGEPITLGVLTLALISHGAVTALIQCFKAYLSRERALTIRLTRPDGTQVKVDACNVDTSTVREALEMVTSTH
jgi:hypothetical protein